MQVIVWGDVKFRSTDEGIYMFLLLKNYYILIKMISYMILWNFNFKQNKKIYTLCCP